MRKQFVSNVESVIFLFLELSTMRQQLVSNATSVKSSMEFRRCHDPKMQSRKIISGDPCNNHPLILGFDSIWIGEIAIKTPCFGTSGRWLGTAKTTFRTSRQKGVEDRGLCRYPLIEPREYLFCCPKNINLWIKGSDTFLHQLNMGYVCCWPLVHHVVRPFCGAGGMVKAKVEWPKCIHSF